MNWKVANGEGGGSGRSSLLWPCGKVGGERRLQDRNPYCIMTAGSEFRSAGGPGMCPVASEAAGKSVSRRMEEYKLFYSQSGTLDRSENGYVIYTL